MEDMQCQFYNQSFTDIGVICLPIRLNRNTMSLAALIVHAIAV